MNHDFLSTDGLVESGVIDLIWGYGWRKPTVHNLLQAQHGIDQSPSSVPLPKRAVISCFAVHLHPCLVQLERDGFDGRYVLIVRDGDPSLINTAWPSCVHHVFAHAVPFSDPKVTPMPWGFYIPLDYRTILMAKEVPRSHTHRVMVSYSLDMPGSVYKADHERITAIEHFRQYAWATVNETLLGWSTRVSHTSPTWRWPEYLKMLRSHDYVAVPVGYGVDRMAAWEAMALGTIPICRRHPELLQFQDTPICFVNDWSEVTEAWCDANLEAARARSIEKIRLSHWVLRIREKAAEL